ncbi:MAG TPA: DUF4396 domain-containing protein [Myxococcales bacterium]|nr:DUF4396 domain-containing protein [Myxococcales bacterium]
MQTFPGWLDLLAVLFLAASAASAVLIAADIFLRGHRQSMWIMDVVWPVTALWSGPFGVHAYDRWGRAGERRAVMAAKKRDEVPPNKRQPFPVLTAKGATHCGSGCTLGDVAAELLILAVPLSLFGRKIFGAWVYDYFFAFSNRFSSNAASRKRCRRSARALRSRFLQWITESVIRDFDPG